MSQTFLIPMVLLMTCGAAEPGEPTPATDQETPFPVALCFVPEMGYIPEVDDWDFCPAGHFPEHSAAVQAAWEKLIPWASKHVTPQVARDLSRWARPQMEGYTQVPPLANAKLKLAYQHPKGHRLAYEITVDTLPSHAPLVTRWLKVYLIYNTGSKSINRMTVTIRGERLE